MKQLTAALAAVKPEMEYRISKNEAKTQHERLEDARGQRAKAKGTEKSPRWWDADMVDGDETTNLMEKFAHPLTDQDAVWAEDFEQLKWAAKCIMMLLMYIVVWGVIFTWSERNNAKGPWTFIDGFYFSVFSPPSPFPPRQSCLVCATVPTGLMRMRCS